MPRISTDNYDTVASWNGSQDLFIVEQPDGTKVATPAMVKQYVLGNSIDDIYSVMGQMGAKNLISYPYYTPDVYTTNGITFTVNEDRSVTATGTATATAQYSLHSRAIGSNNELRVKNGDYIISDGGLQNVNTEIQVGVTKNGVYQQLAFTRNGEAEFTINGDDYAEDSANVQITLVVRTGATTPVTFKPMLRLASDTDDTYQPYAKTNKELTEVIGDLSQTGLTGDSVAEQLTTANTAIGERAIRVKANTSNTKQFTFPRSIWADNGMTSSSSHTALFSGGYNNRISAGLVATNGTGVSVIKLGDNTVTATISGNNIELAFNDTVYTDLYLILLN